MTKPLDAIFFDIDDTLFSTTVFADKARRNAIDAMIRAGLNAKRDGTRALLGRMGIGPHGQFRLKPVRRFPQPDLAIPARPIIPKQAPQAALVPAQPAAQPSPQALPKPPVVEVEMN